MVYFNKSYITFFKKLSNNNSVDWFNANSSVFESVVNAPFEKFIFDLINNIHLFDPTVRILPIDAIYKIAKTVRSSSCIETPYYTYMSAFISRFGKKTRSYPGTYIKIDTQSITLRFGILECDTYTLEKIRNSLIADYDTLEYIINKSSFKSYFNKLKGSKTTVLSPMYKELVNDYPLIEYSQYYCEVDIDISLITAGKLMELIIQHYKVAKPLNDFLTRALT